MNNCVGLKAFATQVKAGYTFFRVKIKNSSLIGYVQGCILGIKNLYEQEILDHYQHPRNFGILLKFDFISPVYNPSCGDSITMSGVVKDNKIEQIGFEGKGCILSIAMASKLTLFVQGRSCDEVLAYNIDLVEQLLNIQLGPKRMQCGLLSLQALQNGIRAFLKKL